MKCHKCGEMGHRERYCPNRNAWQGGNSGNVASIQAENDGNTFIYEDMYRKNEYVA